MKRPTLRWPRAREVRAVGYVLAATLVAAGVGFHLFGGGGTSIESPPPDPPVRDLTVLDEAQTEKLRTLRNEALDCMGWAAGNSFRQPIWPEVESYVGHRGIYYEDFIGLVPPGLPSDVAEAETSANYERYRDAFLRGRGTLFDEAEARGCVERAIRISDEIERLLEEVREPRSLDSPVSLD